MACRRIRIRTTRIKEKKEEIGRREQNTHIDGISAAAAAATAEETGTADETAEDGQRRAAAAAAATAEETGNGKRDGGRRRQRRRGTADPGGRKKRKNPGERRQTGTTGTGTNGNLGGETRLFEIPFEINFSR